MSKETITTEEKAEADMSLAFVEGQADVWAQRINLNSMIENIASPMRLNRNAPDDVKAKFAKRMKEQMDAIIRQAFIEGAVLAQDRFQVTE